MCTRARAQVAVGDWMGNTLRDVNFAPSNPFLLHAACSGGEVCVWDTRTRRQVRSLHVEPAGSMEDEFGLYAVTSSTPGDVIAASNMNEIVFWDVRMEARPLGTYADAHAAVVSQLHFHPVIPHHLVSASDDGLACIFDVSIRGEQDALVTVLNAGSSIARFGFFGSSAAYAWVITRTDQVSLWNLGSAQRVADFPMLKMQLMEAGATANSLITCHYDDETERLELLAGAHDGSLAVFDVLAGSIVPRGSLKHAHSGLVRAAAWARTGASAGTRSSGTVMFTAGEDALVTQWLDPAAYALLPPSRGTSASSSEPHSEHSRPRHAWRRESRYVRQAGATSDADAFASRALTGSGGGGGGAGGDEGGSAGAAAVSAETAPRRSDNPYSPFNEHRRLK